jgi:phytoene synthase
VTNPAQDRWGFPNPATPPGSSAYYAVRFAPRGERDALATLFGWRHLVRSVLVTVSDRGVAARKLAWWHDEIEVIHAGGGRHPIALPLGQIIRDSALPLRSFVEVLWATEAILNGRKMPDLNALVGLAEQDLGAIFELVARRLDAETPHRARAESAQGSSSSSTESIACARRAGAYCGLIALMRGSGRLLRQGHIDFWPEDRRLKVSSTRHAHSGAALAPLFADLDGEVAPLRRSLDTPLAALPTTVRIHVRLADALLAELRESGFAVADQHIALTPIRKLWIAWRASRDPGQRKAVPDPGRRRLPSRDGAPRGSRPARSVQPTSSRESADTPS